MKKYAIITGADGGMGAEITRSLCCEDYHVVMACCNIERANKVRNTLACETGNTDIEVLFLDLSSMECVKRFSAIILDRNVEIGALMLNAGILETEGRTETVDGLERTVSVNYVGHYLLTRLLISCMSSGSRIVAMSSLTYRFGRIDYNCFFNRGCRGSFLRIAAYSNTKLALTLFALRLSRELDSKGVKVNIADPGIVSTDIIRFRMWFDPLTDIFFRPFIRTPYEGAKTAISLLTTNLGIKNNGRFFSSCKCQELPNRILDHSVADRLWQETENVVSKWLD